MSSTIVDINSNLPCVLFADEGIEIDHSNSSNVELVGVTGREDNMVWLLCDQSWRKIKIEPDYANVVDVKWDCG